MRVCVVGAGASGLPAIKTCLENGLNVVCYEKSADIAGLWRYKPDPSPGEGTVMKSTVINTSKEMTAYSDFVPPTETPNFMHNRQMVAYFRQYAAKFNLIQHIRFRYEVLKVSRTSNFLNTGQWEVNCQNLRNGQCQVETFDAVMLCIGHHTIPHWPNEFPGQNEFRNRIIHSHDYKDGIEFIDKTVMIVGIGNSGVDIAVELSRLAKQVYLSTRSGCWVMNRIWERGESHDCVFFNRFVFAFKQWLPFSMINSVIERKINKRFDHGRYGLRPANRFLQTHVTVNDELPNRIASGTVIIKPNVESFGENDVRFEDGSTVSDVDCVIFATGYSFHFSLIENGALVPVNQNRVSLYQYMFPPQLAPINTLAIIGLIQPLGSIMPISEMQCRLFCEVLTGRVTLPPAEKMMKNVERKRREMARQYVERRRHTIQVYYVDYMDELARMIGVKPNLVKHFFTDQRLFQVLLFEGLAPYQYRLTGPNRWVGAREALLGLRDRTFEATRTRKTMETMRSRPFNKFLYLLRLAV